LISRGSKFSRRSFLKGSVAVSLGLIGLVNAREGAQEDVVPLKKSDNLQQKIEDCIMRDKKEELKELMYATGTLGISSHSDRYGKRVITVSNIREVNISEQELDELSNMLMYRFV